MTFAIRVMAMTSKRGVFLILSILLVLISSSCSRNEEFSERIKNIFLSKHFNSTETEWILTSARESYSLLRSVEKQPDDDKKVNFVNSYASFLLKLLKELRTKDVEAHQIFSEENSFLKDYHPGQSSQQFNLTELKSEVEDVQVIAEQHLITHYNTSNEYHDALEVLALNKTSFDVFLKEKLRADYSQIGYFFLEVFATLIGLSWGVISTVLHVAHPINE